jgi:hypothetical protein
MKPLKKITATMKTVPATMPTQAATALSLERRGRRSRSTYVDWGGGVVVATGLVVGSSDDDVDSLIGPRMQPLPMRLS